ncbi:MAG: hypothetical protein QXR45_06755 [Candidatus Bathyarchaeia archaeon]
MLKVEKINAEYGDVQVLWEVSFDVREGGDCCNCWLQWCWKNNYAKSAGRAP